MQKFWVPLLILLLLASWIRFWHVDRLPNGLYWDEVAISYDAWGVSIDGKDQWGKLFPLVFTSFGDGKLPATIYMLAGLYKLGGFHPDWLRYLTAGFGVLLVAGVFFLTRKVFGGGNIGLLSAFLVATSSWAIHFSRFGLEAGIGTTLSLWSIYFLYKSEKISHDCIGIILLTLSAYTYHGNLLIAPFVLMILGWKRLRSLFFIVLLAPLIWGLSQSSWIRAEQTVFWKAPGFEITTGHIVEEIGHQIVQHLSASFWIKGIQPNLRQAVPHFFVLYPIELVFLLAGIWWLPKKYRFLIWLMLLGFLPSFIGNPSPHTIRAFTAFPFIKIIEGYGLWVILTQSKWVGSVAFGLYLVWFGLFWRYYTTSYCQLSEQDFQYGYGHMLRQLQSLEQSNTTFVISPVYGQPYIYTLLYWHISPPEYRAGGLANVTFRPIKWPEPQDGFHLYAGSPAEIPSTDPRVISTSPQWVIAR